MDKNYIKLAKLHAELHEYNPSDVCSEDTQRYFAGRDFLVREFTENGVSLGAALKRANITMDNIYPAM